MNNARTDPCTLITQHDYRDEDMTSDSYEYERAILDFEYFSLYVRLM